MSDSGGSPVENCPVFDSGLYVFVMRLRTPDFLEVGALGRFHFPAGWYLYSGSAKRNLHKRVERHWSLKKKVRWHIDYLTTLPDSEPVGAVLVPTEAGISECELNLKVGRMIGGQALVPGFGASDCRKNSKTACPAHLWFSLAPVSVLSVARIHPEAAVLLPGAGVWEPKPLDLEELD